jgi:hypothetical protein
MMHSVSYTDLVMKEVDRSEFHQPTYLQRARGVTLHEHCFKSICRNEAIAFAQALNAYCAVALPDCFVRAIERIPCIHGMGLVKCGLCLCKRQAEAQPSQNGAANVNKISNLQDRIATFAIQCELDPQLAAKHRTMCPTTGRHILSLDFDGGSTDSYYDPLTPACGRACDGRDCVLVRMHVGQCSPDGSEFVEV